MSEYPSGRCLLPLLVMLNFKKRGKVPKYKVTGDANVTIKDIEYKTGETFEASPKDAKWLVDDGYISPVSQGAYESKTPQPEASGDDE